MKKMMDKALTFYLQYLCVFLLLAAGVINADTWFFEEGLHTEQYKFGNTTIVKIIDATENQRYPTFRTVVYHEDRSEADFKNLTFDVITTFDRGRFYIGVSNSGLSSFAYFILTKEGRLMRAIYHSDALHYCKKSATLSREWVDLNDLDVKEAYLHIDNEFDPKNPYVVLNSVTVRGCDGRRVEVWFDS